MKATIDYLPALEKAYITTDHTNNNLWRDFYSFLCTFIPVEAIEYTEYSITFSWRHYLGVKNDILNFYIANKGNGRFSLGFTEIAIEKTKAANNISYASSLKLQKRSVDDIKSTLKSIGFERELTDNQLGNLNKISQLPAAATFSVPGAGKTTEALAYFFLNASESDRLLVVAPKNAFGAWDEQLLSCVPSLNDNFVRLRGGAAKISEALLHNPRFMIITYDQLPNVENLILSLLDNGNVLTFLDESHRIKGGKKVKRGEVVLNLAHLPKKKLIMSGTPMPQSPKDLIPQFTFLYPETKVDENTVIDTIQPIYVRTNKEQLGIPEITHKVVSVKMPPLQRELYNTLRSETKRQLASIDDNSRASLRRIGKSIMKVMEFTSNPALLASDMGYAFNQKVGELLLHSNGPKIDYVCRRARELALQNKKVIIWSCFVQNVETIAMRLRDLGAEYIHGQVDAGDENDSDTREGKIKRFHDDPNCMVLVANPAACSEGISLHKVCQYAIYLDRSFNAAHYLQSEDRIHRLGLAKDSHPTVEFVECEESIDQVVRDRLQMKVQTMAEALNDPSLKVNPDYYDEDDEDNELDDVPNSLNSDDAIAIMNYFFGDIS